MGTKWDTFAKRYKRVYDGIYGRYLGRRGNKGSLIRNTGYTIWILSLSTCMVVMAGSLGNEPIASFLFFN